MWLVELLTILDRFYPITSAHIRGGGWYRSCKGTGHARLHETWTNGTIHFRALLIIKCKYINQWQIALASYVESSTYHKM